LPPRTRFSFGLPLLLRCTASTLLLGTTPSLILLLALLLVPALLLQPPRGWLIPLLTEVVALATLPVAIPLLLLAIAVATAALLPLGKAPALKILTRRTTALLLAITPAATAALGLAVITATPTTELVLPVAAALILPVPATPALRWTGATRTSAIPPPIPSIATVDSPLVAAVAAVALHHDSRKGASEWRWIWGSRESAKRQLPAPSHLKLGGWKP
jgi:hypothetical protein